MSNTVFILGAGASERAGVPLMKNFLDVARDLLETGKIQENADSFEKVLDGLRQLTSVHTKSELDLWNVESAFAAFEMGKILKRFAGYNIDQIEELVDSMRQVIVKTIEKTLKLPVHDERRPHPPEPYGDFVSLIHDLQAEANPRCKVSIITFNYDMAIDYSFYYNSIPLDYSMGGNLGCIPVLKLHGSLNWAYCPDCNTVIPWSLDDYFKKHHWELLLESRIDYASLQIGTHLAKEYTHKHCGKKALHGPVIVPPTWNKTAHHQTLSIVWSRAAKELSDAENIFIIGYSLPESDAFFRYLYSIGTVGKTLFKRFIVVNPDDSGETRDRYWKLLGSQARGKFNYMPIDFSNSIVRIRKNFQF